MDKIKKNKIELLAPAGNLEKMKTAFLFGADAVYLGIPDFSLRVRINDFDLDGIKKATKYVHDLGKKVYVTINIFAHNKHLDKLSKYLNELKKIKIDALIISDPGVLQMVKEEWPEVEIHLSTQANCTNWQSAKFWFDLGVTRIILGRETKLEEIKVIHKKVPKVELEYFIHGAMCMSYSGRCFLSSYYLGRSANLGDCVQPCRWNFKMRSVELNEEKRPDKILELVEEEHESYILNSKDLCLIEHVDDLIKSGVTSLKIEGRAKSVYYIATVVGAYKEVIDELLKYENIKTREYKNTRILEQKVNFLKSELEMKLIHRGYSTGFLLEGNGEQQTEISHEKSDWEFCGVVLESAKKGQLKIKVHNSLKIDDEVEILKPYYDIIKLKIEKLVDAKNNKEISEAHGGSGQEVVLELDQKIPEGSILRRVVT